MWKLWCVWMTVLWIPGAVHAQTGPPVYNMEQLIHELNGRNAAKGIYRNIEGSPYFNPKFTLGKITYRKGKPLESVPLRYNVYEDVIEYYLNRHTMQLLAFPEVEQVYMGDTLLVFGQHQHKRDLVTGYYFLLEAGPISLLEKPRIFLLEPQAAKPMQAAKPSRFSPQEPLYCLELPDGHIEEFSSLKQLKQLLKAYEPELSSFIKEQKISPRNPEELKELIRYINSLPTPQ